MCRYNVRILSYVQTRKHTHSIKSKTQKKDRTVHTHHNHEDKIKNIKSQKTQKRHNGRTYRCCKLFESVFSLSDTMSLAVSPLAS